MYQKKSKKKLWIILILVLILGWAGVGGYYYWKAQKAAQKEKQELVLEANQSLTYVSIQKILGNEMTGTILEDGQETQSQNTWLIPVGTDVETKLGTITTFARLAAGDQIKMLMQTTENGNEEIIKIWIEQ